MNDMTDTRSSLTRPSGGPVVWRRMLPSLLILSMVVTACGKKGPPKPPIKQRPQAVSDLAVRQQGRTVLVTFSLPTTDTRGETLRDLKEIQVMRLTLEEPTASVPVDQEEEAGVPRGRFIPAYDFLDDAEILKTLGRADIAARYTGRQVELVDDLATEPIGGVVPSRYYYGVVTVDGEGRESDVSNLDSIVPLLPPSGPTDLVATYEGAVVNLSWSAPSGQRPPLGYNVYRREGEGSPQMLSLSPVKSTEFTDLRPPAAKMAFYEVRSTATSTKPFVESEEGAHTSVTFADTLAPAPPTRVRVASGPSGLEIYWERSQSSDTAGYHVYRENGGEPLRVTDSPVPETVFIDGSASAGTTYRYRVTAVDAAGNESDRSDPGQGSR